MNARQDRRRRWACAQCGREYRIAGAAYCVQCGVRLTKRPAGKPAGRQLLIDPATADIAARIASDIGITTAELLANLLRDAHTGRGGDRNGA